MNVIFKRYAAIVGYNITLERVGAYLPRNYVLEGTAVNEHGEDVVIISGYDSHGWTLDGYVLPRLASGLWFGTEIDLSHPLMKQVAA